MVVETLKEKNDVSKKYNPARHYLNLCRNQEDLLFYICDQKMSENRSSPFVLSLNSETR